MNLPRNIILTGFMGTGKTTVGRCLAEKLGWSVIDTDVLIETREGKTIPDLFVKVGERAFREIETSVIRELLEEEKTVITLGGGAVMQPINRELLQQAGLFICLNARPETILERIESETHRPLLEGGDRLSRIQEILSERGEIYEKIPNQVETDGNSPEEIAEEIIKNFN